MQYVVKIFRKFVQVTLLLFDIVVPSKGIPVLLYHRIVDNNKKSSIVSIDLITFEKQIVYLKRKGYRTLTVDQLDNILYHHAKIPRKAVMITFDDGFSDNMEAFQILHKYNYSSICFLATAFIDQRYSYMPFWFEKNSMDYFGSRIKDEEFIFLSRKQIRDASSLGVEFCPHTHHHVDLTRHSIESARGEIIASSNAIAEMTSKKMTCFSYPLGKYDEQTINMIKREGFKLAFAVFPGTITYSSNPFILPRNNAVKEKLLFYLLLTDKMRIYEAISKKMTPKRIHETQT